MKSEDLVLQVIKEKQQKINRERQLVKKKEKRKSIHSIITSLILIIGIIISLAKVVLEILF